MSQEDITEDSGWQFSFSRPRSVRLRSTKDFRHCYETGERAGDTHLLLIAAAGVGRCVRAGVSVSKKHGNAVRRNRRKRLLREAFRLSRHRLPALDLILIPRQNVQSTLGDYQASLVSLGAQLEKRIHREQRPDN